MEYGLQLFSIRDKTEKDLAGALQEVSMLGYHHVEFAGFFGHSANEITAMLNENGLSVSGTHTAWQELADKFEETVAYHKAIGNQNIIIPGADLDTKEQVDDFIRFLNEVQPKLKKEGIALHYHNHDGEFRPNKDGVTSYWEIVNRTEVMLEIDTYWVYAAKLNPLELMDRFENRMSVIHLKDGLPDGEGKPLGLGTAPVADVLKKAKEKGFTIVVESETLTPSGMEEAKICIDYLKQFD